MRRRLYFALTAGARGVVFGSQTSLEAAAPEASARAAAIELLNLELDLLEPWIAAARSATTAASSDPAWTATVLQTDRAWLLAPMPVDGKPQRATRGVVSFTALGVPDSFKPYRLSLGGMEPLHRFARVSGGVQVQLPATQADQPVVFLRADDVRLLSRLQSLATQHTTRAAHLLRLIVEWEIGELESIAIELASLRGTAPPVASLNPVKVELREADAALSRGVAAQAYAAASRAAALSETLRGVLIDAAQASLGGPGSSVLAGHTAMLPQHWRLASDLYRGRLGENIAPQGGFESFDELVDAGWTHVRKSSRDVLTGAQLTENPRRGGRRSLHLFVRRGSASAPRTPHQPPMWIRTPRVALPPGVMARIDFFAKTESAGGASEEPLLVFDGVAGPAAGMWVGDEDWRQYTLYRAAGDDGTLQITFALADFAEAWLDDVSIRPVLGTPVQQAPPAVNPQGGVRQSQPPGERPAPSNYTAPN